MRPIFFFITALLCAAACTPRVQLQTKDPLKVDINMRVDVYQHVVEEADSIEDQIYGDSPTQLNWLFGIQNVYAQDSGVQIEDAIAVRKELAPKVKRFFEAGYVGENRNGYIELIDMNIAPEKKEEIQQVIEKENKARRQIYRVTAAKNNLEVSQVERIFFRDHYKRAASGDWFERYDKTKGKHVWEKK
ncbi:MAG: YnbE family lipoprotein [Candidatus Omnitrophica bacterium]|nr:YnbE family lipoprotein [Candidatus Omnitrophota bacterium]